MPHSAFRWPWPVKDSKADKAADTDKPAKSTKSGKIKKKKKKAKAMTPEEPGKDVMKLILSPKMKVIEYAD